MTTTTTKPLTGRRKEAVARVRLVAGTGQTLVNGRPALDYLRRQTLVLHAFQALTVANLSDKLDVHARVAGGGLTGQAGAIRMGVARALVRQHLGYRLTATFLSSRRRTELSSRRREAPVGT